MDYNVIRTTNAEHTILGDAAVPEKASIGEFEEMVLLALIRHADGGALAPEVAEELERHAGREVSRGAMYTTLDRLERKGLVRWHIEAHTSERPGSRKRRFEATAEGVRAVASRRAALLSLWAGIEGVLNRAR